MNNQLRIVFMGTPEFAVPSLKILVENNYNVVAVITAPDKPAGRGYQLQESAVKKFALQVGLKILQPINLKSELFLSELKSLHAELQVVVAFRMLPDVVWQLPEKGTFNLHASLLPQYRGAAPIQRAIMNGEKETGATTFFLQHEIDTGKIIFQEKILIGENETAGELHDRLMISGAELVLKTVQAIESRNFSQVPQVGASQLKTAPKIHTSDCLVDWKKTSEEIFNQVRGLSSHPAAFTKLGGRVLKIFRAQKMPLKIPSGKIESDQKTFLRIGTGDGALEILELQLEGKKKMMVEDFLRGNKLDVTNVSD